MKFLSITFFIVCILAFPKVTKSAESKAKPKAKPWAESWAVTFDFHPQVTNFTAQDSLLSAYGFQPVKNIFMPSFGIRGWFRHHSQFIFGMGMYYGILSTEATEQGVADTVVQFNSFGAAFGYRFWFINYTLDIGFASRSIALGNTTGGGALTYLGPYIEFQMTYTIVKSPSAVEIGVGYAAHFPVGDAHNNPLWGDKFSIPAFHSFTFTVRSGFGS